MLVARAAHAQTVGGSIQGTVTDASGAPTPGATVIVRNVGTGDTRELMTDDTGRYHAPLLPPGEYVIKASLKEFQSAERSGIRLDRRSGRGDQSGARDRQSPGRGDCARGCSRRRCEPQRFSWSFAG